MWKTGRRANAVPKVRELIHFEEIKEVIAINAIEDPKEIVSKYVISENIRNRLLELISQLGQNKHKSINIIGDYGTGKSHLLAFISLIMQDKELRNLVQDEQVRKALETVDREYVIVQFELPATQEISLAEIFYDQLQDQLRNKYGIELEGFEFKREYDHKKYMEEVVTTVKKKDPSLGLMVIIDEVSDFMKQKQRHDMHFDLQFMRQIGEVSQSIDFLYIGSMQEHVFTNPKYVDQAESISRVSERFTDVNIGREEINRVVGNRVVRKNNEQIEQLRELFRDLKPHFTNLITDEELYLLLYPVHPYVVQIFKELPYFEHRGIISFVVGETKRILDENFPIFITYDCIYDLIERTHSIRNLEEVRPVMETIRTLNSKIDLLEPRLHTDARKIVKALAVLHLARETGKNGATPQELANTLLISPQGRVIQSTDNIERILKRIRDVTSGQFITRSKDGLYFLDLKAHVDFEFKIQQEADYNLPQGAEEEEFRRLLIEKLALGDSFQKYVFNDSCTWLSRNSFKEGWFIIETSDTEPRELEPYDYQFHVLSNYKERTAFKKVEGQIILNPNFDEQTINVFKRLAAIKQLIIDNYYRDVMIAKREDAYKKCAEKLKECIINRGVVEFGGTRRVSAIVPSSPNLDALFSTLKSNLLEDYFGRKYKKHPTFGQRISAQNIGGTVASVIRDITSRGLSELGLQSLNILKSLDLVEGASIETTRSEFVKRILDMLEKAGGKNVSTENIVQELGKPHYGLPREIVYLLLSVLLFNGEVVFVEKGGKRVYASDFSEVFKRGLEYFNEVRYILPEEEVPIQLVNTIFDALQLQKGLVRNKKTWPDALRSFRERVIEMKNDIQEIRDSFQRLQDDRHLPLEDLRGLIAQLEDLPLDELEKVRNSLADFKRLSIATQEIDGLKANYTLLNQLLAAIREYHGELRQGLRYMEDAINVLSKHSTIFPSLEVEEIKIIFEESRELICDIKKFLKEDERRPLKGKGQQFKRRYSHMYYQVHEKTVGKLVSWTQLDDLVRSKQYKKLQRLGSVRCINSSPFTELALEISQIKDKKCDDLIADDLDVMPTCRSCRFPEGITFPVSIDKRVDEISTRIKSILKSWEKQILTEIHKNKEQLQLLSRDEMELVETVVKGGKLPEDISDELIKALNNLFENLKVVSVHVDELFDYLTRESDVLTLDELTQRFEKFKDEKLSGLDPRNVRFRIQKRSSNGANKAG